MAKDTTLQILQETTPPISGWVDWVNKTTLINSTSDPYYLDNTSFPDQLSKSQSSIVKTLEVCEIVTVLYFTIDLILRGRVF